jgi:hypothetical protein
MTFGGFEGLVYKKLPTENEEIQNVLKDFSEVLSEMYETVEDELIDSNKLLFSTLNLLIEQYIADASGCTSPIGVVCHRLWLIALAHVRDGSDMGAHLCLSLSEVLHTKNRFPRKEEDKGKFLVELTALIKKNQDKDFFFTRSWLDFQKQ